MNLDPTSLYIALGFTTLALTATLLLNWLAVRADKFLVTWSVGVGVLIFAFCGYAFYSATFSFTLLWAANVFLTSALLIIHRSTQMFAGKRPGVEHALIQAGLVLGVLTLPFLAGFDALGAVVGNVINAGILVHAAWNFWKKRSEEPVMVLAIGTLYAMTGLSFLPCAALIYLDDPLHLSAPPDSWAVALNTLVGVISMTAVGALSLAFNQARAARRHERDARTDPLTGLLNRRGLDAGCGDAKLAIGTSVVVFDLDQFKQVNDTYGHAAGDFVLKAFAQVIRECAPSNATCVRLGGEEFALVMPDMPIEDGLFIAEAIRVGFENRAIDVSACLIRCTASAGITGVDDEPIDVYGALRRADIALYKSKSGGRNRVTRHGGFQAA